MEPSSAEQRTRQPLLRQAGRILFDKFDRRYKDGLNLILGGAALEERISG
jgi:hypothetical protein